MADTSLKAVNFPPGHVLIKQGERGKVAWLIIEGDVEIYTAGDDGAKRLARVSSRHMVGEMALIDNGLRTATVVAKTPVTAAELPRNMFEKMLAGCEPLARHVLSHLVNAVRAGRGVAVAESLISGPTIRSTDDSARILERRVFAPGQIIFREGEIGEAAYLIQSGGVTIMRGETTVATLGPGRTFGEMALLRNSKRVASAVVGESGAAVEIIRRREFDLAMNSMPRILQALAQSYLTYLAQQGDLDPPPASDDLQPPDDLGLD
jgi:CRP-like cAMP-binding protein